MQEARKLEACLRLLSSKISERNIFCKASDCEDVSGVMVYYAAVYVEFLVSSEILTGIFSP